jgi:hypothetical protein
MPVRTGCKQGKVQVNCFHILGHETEKAEQLPLLSLPSQKQEHRFLLLQCHTLPKTLCSTPFAAVKRPTEGGLSFFFFRFLPLPFALEGFWGLCFLGFWLDSFALGFSVWEALGRDKNY